MSNNLDLDSSICTDVPLNARTSSELNPQKNRVKLINFVLVVLIVGHLALLMTLVLYQDSDAPIKVITFVHYYPMAAMILVCFAFIYWRLRTYLTRQ